MFEQPNQQLSRIDKIREYYSVNTVRRLVVSIVVFIISLSVIYGVVFFLTHGKITLDSDIPDSTLSIRSEKGTVKQAFGQHLSAWVTRGKYTVSAVGSKQNYSASKTIEVKPLKTTSYHFEKPSSDSATQQIEPVASLAASGVHATETLLYFIDSDTNLLSKLDSSGKITPLSNKVFTSVQWSKDSTGVALDSANALYRISNGNLVELSLNSLENSSATPIYSLSSNGTLYVALGKDIYIATNDQFTSFKKIYTAVNDSISLSASDTNLLIANYSQQAEGSGEATDSFTVIDKTGKVIKALQKTALSFTYSPNGDNIITSSSNSTVYDKNLNEINTAPITDVSVASWKNDTTLLYANNSQIWSFDVTSGVSKVVATGPVDATISDINISSDGRYAYVFINNTGDSVSSFLGRINLVSIPNQSDFVYSLNIFFPSHSDDCYFNYTNFIKPTLVTTYVSSKDSCVAKAKNELIQDNLPRDKFNYLYIKQSGED